MHVKITYWPIKELNENYVIDIALSKRSTLWVYIDQNSSNKNVEMMSQITKRDIRSTLSEGVGTIVS